MQTLKTASAALALSMASVAFAGTISPTTEVLQAASFNKITGEFSIDGPVSPIEVSEVVFSAIPGPYSAFAAASGPLGFDDYDSTFTGGTSMGLESMRFVGGVTTVGGAINFSFYDSPTATTPTLSEDFSFPAAGNFIWTLTGFSGPVPADGVLELTAASTTTGRWFLAAAGPTVGLENRAYGSSTTVSHRFELVTPEPTSLSALAGLSVIARRRRN